MRRLHHSLWVALVIFAAPCAIGRAEPREKAPANAPRLPPLKVLIDKSKVDIDRHRLEVRLSREASNIQIKVFGESGNVLADEEHDFSGRAAGTPLIVKWSPSSDEAVARIDVYAHDSYGYYAGVRIVPWALWIPHEEVNFTTDSSEIRGSEEPKLQDSLEKIRSALSEHKDLGSITLYIAGHTDTQGSDQHNLELSRRRARSIAGWFRRHGLKIPISYEGFGEHAPAVKTADEVDEPRNRRVDYVLSVEEPRFKNSDRTPAWKAL